MHRDIYNTGHKLAKRDKLGIHREVENTCLNLLVLLIEAAFSKKENKLIILEAARIQSELLKNITRTEQELNIIDERTYMRLAKDMVDVSKMLNGWIVYISKL